MHSYTFRYIINPGSIFASYTKIKYITSRPYRFGMSLSVNFFETDGRYCSISTPTCHISFSIPRRLADQKSDSQPTDYSDKLLHSNYSKPRFSAKSQKVRALSCSEIHLHRYGISDAIKFSQGSNGSCTEPNSDNQENNVSQTCIGTNFPVEVSQERWVTYGLH